MGLQNVALSPPRPNLWWHSALALLVTVTSARCIWFLAYAIHWSQTSQCKCKIWIDRRRCFYHQNEVYVLYSMYCTGCNKNYSVEALQHGLLSSLSRGISQAHHHHQYHHKMSGPPCCTRTLKYRNVQLPHALQLIHRSPFLLRCSWRSCYRKQVPSFLNQFLTFSLLPGAFAFLRSKAVRSS